MTITTAPHHSKYTRLGAPAAVIGVLAGAFAAVPAEAAVAAPSSYTVQPGDTVYSIAERFGLATADVLAWNGLTWRSVIYPGSTLLLTAPPALTAVPVPQSPTLFVDPVQPTLHTVVAGDTIFGIAQQYGTTVEAVLKTNSLSQASIIYPGQKILIDTNTKATTGTEDSSTGDSSDGNTDTEVSTTLNAPQAENATLIIQIGRELGVSDRGIAIALGTSMVESWLRNLDWGDRDSLGLFQQRPSAGWGTPEQIMNRDYSIRAFFLGVTNADGTSTRGLLDIPGWENMSFADAAQAVQISAYPDRYAAWETAAYEWIALYG